MDITAQDLRDQVLKMAGLVEAALELAVNPNNTKSDVYKLENEINKCHTTIDDNCFKYIALKNPHATDLRVALSVMKINSDLERMGDQAVNIKRYQKRLSSVYPELKSMYDEVMTMVRTVLDAFSTKDTTVATNVIQNDQEINDMNREIIHKYLEKMKNNSISFDEGFFVLKFAKSLERIGDLTTNIAEDVIFVETGKDIRHNPELKYGRRKTDSEQNPDTKYGKKRDDIIKFIGNNDD